MAVASIPCIVRRRQTFWCSAVRSLFCSHYGSSPLLGWRAGPEIQLRRTRQRKRRPDLFEEQQEVVCTCLWCSAKKKGRVHNFLSTGGPCNHVLCSRRQRLVVQQKCTIYANSRQRQPGTLPWTCKTREHSEVGRIRVGVASRRIAHVWPQLAHVGWTGRPYGQCWANLRQIHELNLFTCSSGKQHGGGHAEKLCRLAQGR